MNEIHKLFLLFMQAFIEVWYLSTSHMNYELWLIKFYFCIKFIAIFLHNEYKAAVLK